MVAALPQEEQDTISRWDQFLEKVCSVFTEWQPKQYVETADEASFKGQLQNLVDSDMTKLQPVPPWRRSWRPQSGNTQPAAAAEESAAEVKAPAPPSKQP